MIAERLHQANRAARLDWTEEEESSAFSLIESRYVRHCLDHRSDDTIETLRRSVDAAVEASGVKGGRALDLGAGEGRSTQRLAELGFDAVGVERSALVAGRSDEQVVVGNAEAIPIEGASQELVLCQSVLEHVLNPASVLAEIYRVLRPGGVCVLNTTNQEHWRTGEIRFPLFQLLPVTARTWIWYMSGRGHIAPHFFTYRGLMRLAESAGLEASTPYDDLAPPSRSDLLGTIARFAHSLSPGMTRRLHFIKASVVELRLAKT